MMDGEGTTAGGKQSAWDDSDVAEGSLSDSERGAMTSFRRHTVSYSIVSIGKNVCRRRAMDVERWRKSAYTH